MCRVGWCAGGGIGCESVLGGLVAPRRDFALRWIGWEVGVVVEFV